MQVRRAKRVIWIAITLAILFATGVRALPPVSTEPPLPASAPMEPSLLAHATKVMRPPLVNVGYQWLSQDTVLFYILYGESGWKAARVNVTTQQVTAYQGDEYIHNNPDVLAASPDGSWLAGYADDGSVVAVSLTGKNMVLLDPKPLELSSRWLSDSRHWLEAIYNDTQHTMRARVCDLNGAIKPGPILHGDPGTPIGITANRHLFCITLNADRRLHLSDYDLTGVQRTRRARITLPRDVIWADLVGEGSVVVSLHGDRIAYLLSHQKPPVLSAPASQNYQIDPTAFYKMSVWVSRGDGTHMREVGALAMDKDANGTTEPHLLRWLPDGKHLSFMLYENLYTVPVH